MGQPTVVSASGHDRERVIATVVAAFARDPAFHYFFSDGETFGPCAAAFAAYLFDKRVGLGTVFIVDGGASVAMWDGPGAPTLGGPTLQLPDDALARLARYDAAVRDALPLQPHWYLGVLATDPAFAGQRWGRAVMAEGLERARRDGVPSYLETTNPGNVGLYERAGWRVTAQREVDDLAVWVMAHGGRRSGQPSP